MLFDIVRRTTMERTVALKKIGTLLGKNFGWRINSKAPTPEEREAIKTDLPAAFAEKERLKTLRDARYKALLEGDAEYQKLKNDHTEAHKKWGSMESTQRAFKITVGNSVAGLFFSVKAEGDSWEEVIAKLTKKAAA
jgi:hypothetical protein